MRFCGAAVGLVVGVVVGQAVAQALVRYWPWSGPEVPLGRLLQVFGLVVLGCVITGWIIAGHIQDRDGNGLGSRAESDDG